MLPNFKQNKKCWLEGSVYLMCNDPLQHTAITWDADTREKPGDYLKLSC